MYLLAAIATRRDMRPGERVLIFDEDALFDESVSRLFDTLGAGVDRCVAADAVRKSLSTGQYAVLLTHDGHGHTRGLELVCQMHEQYPAVGAILLNASDGPERATMALAKGIFDFMTRDFDAAGLVEHLGDAVQRALAAASAASISSAPSGYTRAGTVRPLDVVRDVLVGDSPALAQARAVLHVATSDAAPVLICGEPGTEKFAVARLLHDLSARRHEPFVVVEATAAITEGSSTALSTQLSAAGRGTFFIPEVSELGVIASVELALMLGRRQWSEATVPRLVPRLVLGHLPGWNAAQGLAPHLSDNRVHRLVLPPLRERGRDVLLLADHFAERTRSVGSAPLGMTASASETLLAYDWPGNVDELRSAIQHAAAMCAESLIRVADLPPALVAKARPARDERNPELKVQSLEDVGLAYISSVLDAVGGNKASAARLLGVDRTTLYRKLQRQEQAAPPPVVETPPAAPRSRK
jgi:two-component system, NtrC family, response regulator AtoC